VSQVQPEPSADQNELERLRAEVALLKGQLASRSTAADARTGSPVAGAPVRGGWWRTLVATILIVTAAILAPLSVVARWAHDEVSDTDRYVQTITPLADDPAVQNAIVTRVTDELFTRIDVQAVTQDAIDALSQQGLSPRASQGLSALSAPLAGGIRSFVTTQVTKIVESDVFADAWVQANRAAHTQFVAVLSGEGTDTVSVEGGVVSINLGPLIEKVKDRLSSSGFTLADRLPTVNTEFTVFESEELAKGQAAFSLLDAVARWLPVLALLLLAIAVFVARNRRKALIWSAVAVAGSMLLLGAALNIFRPVYLNAIDPASLPTDAAAAIYDQLVGFIRLNLRAVLVVALAVAVVAWVTGPAGLTTRRGLSGAVGRLRGSAEHAGLRTGPVGAFVYRWRSALRGVIAGAAVLIYLLEDHPTGASALTLLVVAAVALLLVEFLARPPVDERASGTPVDVTTASA
jgi:hypothetical protein